MFRLSAENNNKMAVRQKSATNKIVITRSVLPVPRKPLYISFQMIGAPVIRFIGPTDICEYDIGVPFIFIVVFLDRRFAVFPNASIRPAFLIFHIDKANTKTVAANINRQCSGQFKGPRDGVETLRVIADKAWKGLIRAMTVSVACWLNSPVPANQTMKPGKTLKNNIYPTRMTKMTL